MSVSPVSSASHRPTRFFGFDLGSLWRDLLTAWRGMMEWPVLAWLWPKLPVRLWLPTGDQALSRGLHTLPIDDKHRIQSARLDACLLPENMLLRRAMNLPRLQSQELMAALDLEVQTLSPFTRNDTLWTHDIESKNNNTLRVDLALTSRNLIAQHIAATHPELALQTSEVWVTRANGPGFLVLPGFGEARRQRQSLAWFWTGILLTLLAVALMAAIAVTPGAQLYLRALQANEAMAALQKNAGPVLAQRESLVRASDQLTSLAELVGKPNPPLQSLKLITDAFPDDTSLLSLQIQGFKVSLSGQTANASALMKQLGSTPGLRDVKAPAPATKPLGAPRESFTIEFTLDPALMKPTS